MPAEISLTSEQRVLLEVKPVTLAGHPAPIDGDPTVTVASGDGTVTPEGTDPKKFWLNSGDNPGDTVFLVEADADLGAGVESIADTVTAHVASPRAAQLGLSLGTPELKP